MNKLSQSVCDLIINQTQLDPQKIAIVDGEKEIDYQSLMARAKVIAAELVAQGAKTGDLIGVCVGRHWQMVASLLGVLQTGCAYVPLDPNYPQQRIDYTLQHSGIKLAIVDNDESAALCHSMGLVRIDHLADADMSALEAVVAPSSSDLAYVIYTSGSTGKPKGVAVEHGAVVALSESVAALLSQDELTGVLASTSMCFDPSVAELFATLSLGGTVILCENILELLELPVVDRVKTCFTVPSATQVLVGAGQLPSNISCWIVGGEELTLPLVAQLRQLKPDLRVINAYGPTEDTVFSSVKEVGFNAGQINIGRPIVNTSAFVLDDELKPVAVGEIGELYLAGNKLARGYLFDQALTDSRFVQLDADNELPVERMYRTGDLCRWNTEGEIEFVGRKDEQVKIRGFRVELGEIESTLLSMDGIEAAAVVAVDHDFAHKALQAFVVTAQPAIETALIKAFLAERLPKHMLPSSIVYVEQLPLLPNGKVDRKRLASNQVEQSRHNISENCREDLLSIVQATLAGMVNLAEPELVDVNRSLDCYELDSLTRVELRNRLSKVLGKMLPTKIFCEQASVTSLVEAIAGLQNDDTDLTAKEESNADPLAQFQSHIRSSHPTFQAAKATVWHASDKAKLVQSLTAMVNDLKRNPYSKVLRSGSGTQGLVADAYTAEAREAIIWTTNLYLGLNRDSQVIDAASAAVKQFGTGMGTSSAASGLTDAHLSFETAFAELVGKPAACLFPTGYTANIGAVAGLLGEHDVVVIDQLCHASIVDGARLSGSTVRTFQHNNVDDLATVLESEVSPYRTVLVVIEGVYSMGEGAAPVAEIVTMAKRYDALVLVDEAHSFGFYGDCGAGICAAQGVTDQVDFIMTTLSKSLGSLGGVVAASKEHVALLKASSRAYIFQASVSPADIAAALAALHRLSSDDGLRERLWQNARYMRQQFSAAGFDLGSGDGPIVTPHFANKDKLYGIVQGLYKRGIQTSGVTYPIVERGRGRLRFICFCGSH